MAVDFENRIDDTIEFECRVDDSIQIDLSTVMAVKVPLPIALQDKRVNPATVEQTVVADDGYDGLSAVEIGAITAELIPNLSADIIEEGKEVLGLIGTFKGGEDLDDEIAEQDTLIAALENVADTFPSKQNLDKEFNIAYAKQADVIREIGGGNPLVERDYLESEMQKLEATLVSLTQGE